jgi:acyl dehydratase
MTTVINGLDELKSLAATGADLGHSGWMEITQDRINAFADATSDHQWIHVDAERAAAGPFGTTIAHGFLTLSLVIPLLEEMFAVGGVSMGINYGLNRVRFPSPVPVGSRIRLAAKLASAEDVSGGAVQVTLDLTMEIEGGAKPACVAQGVYRYYP